LEFFALLSWAALLLPCAIHLPSSATFMGSRCKLHHYQHLRIAGSGRRTSVINQIRGLLLERGITFRKGRRHLTPNIQIAHFPTGVSSGRFSYIRTLGDYSCPRIAKLDAQIPNDMKSVCRVSRGGLRRTLSTCDSMRVIRCSHELRSFGGSCRTGWGVEEFRP
jgi:hypothetical protein